jgi:hypothetical protein
MSHLGRASARVPCRAGERFVGTLRTKSCNQTVGQVAGRDLPIALSVPKI